MTSTTREPLRVGGIYRHQPSGHRVRVMESDSDPTCLVWVVAVTDCDRDWLVQPQHLTPEPRS